MKTLFDQFGIECGDGWKGILDEATKQIHTSCDMHGVNPRHFVIDQIKEKFGGLRYYYHFVGDVPRSLVNHVDRIIAEAEALSTKTCEICGNPGKLKANKGWASTRCDACRS